MSKLANSFNLKNSQENILINDNKFKIDAVINSLSCTKSDIQLIKLFAHNNNFNLRIFDEEKLNFSDEDIAHEFSTIGTNLRFEHFKKAIYATDSKIIWAVRGGYGSSEILEFLYLLPKPKIKKIYIGFSDCVNIATFLNQKWGWSVICAPMLRQLAINSVSESSKKNILKLISGKNTKIKYELNLINPNYLHNKNISGIEVVGGCISVICNNFLTKNQLKWKNKILFFEDEGESGERLDRYFFQIYTIIKEKKQFPAAILLGNFNEANSFGKPESKNIIIALERFCERISSLNQNIPVYIEPSASLGHSFNIMPLLIGVKSDIIDNFIIQYLPEEFIYS